MFELFSKKEAEKIKDKADAGDEEAVQKQKSLPTTDGRYRYIEIPE